MIGAHALYLVASSAGFALGGVYLKKYADSGGWADLGSAFAIFAISNLVYAEVLARGLTQGAVLVSMTHLLLMSAAGLLLFGERLGPYQIAGLVTALITVWLFSMTQQTA